MVAIYATLGPARTLADALRERNLLAISFALVLLLVVVVIVASWVKRRPDWREIGVALAAGFAYLMVWIRIDSWEERTHLIEYGIVAALIHQALLERASHGRRVAAPAALAVALTALLGTIDECIQAMLPSRVFDVRDIGWFYGVHHRSHSRDELSEFLSDSIKTLNKMIQRSMKRIQQCFQIKSRD